MPRVSNDTRTAQNAAGQYLLSHETQIKSVSRQITNAIHNSLIFTQGTDSTDLDGGDNAFGAVKNESCGEPTVNFADLSLYSWYEAYALTPKIFTHAQGDEKVLNSVGFDTEVYRDDKRRKFTNNDRNSPGRNTNVEISGATINYPKCVDKKPTATTSVVVEQCWLEKLPPLDFQNAKYIDLDKIYLYDYYTTNTNVVNTSNVTYKQYDFVNDQWLIKPATTSNDATCNDDNPSESEIEHSVVPSIDCLVAYSPFSVYEENVNFGGWPVFSDDMELGAWVYTSPFIEHCQIDIPTNYVSQVQHMHKKMFKDAETNRIIMWCKKYNYNSPDFIDSDGEEDNNFDPFAAIERNVDDASKAEMAEIYRHLALTSASYVAPCNGYHLKIYGELVEELETTFLRNNMNKLYSRHRRHNLINELCAQIKNRSFRHGLLSPFPTEKLVRLAKSDVHGFGLFAAEDIKKGEFIIEYAGVLVTDAMADVREEAYEKYLGSSTYLFRADDNWVIDATKTGNLARYVNHSCDPNAHTNTIHDEATGPHVGIYASKDISAGQEIFYNYRLSESVSKKEPCYCGSNNCSGRM